MISIWYNLKENESREFILKLVNLCSDAVVIIFVILVFLIVLLGPLALIIDGLRIGIKSINLYKNNKSQNIKNKRSTVVKAIIFLTVAVTNFLGILGFIFSTFDLYKSSLSVFYYLSFLYPLFLIELPALVIYEEITIQKNITKNKLNKTKTIILRILAILGATFIIALEILLLIFIFVIGPV